VAVQLKVPAEAIKNFDEEAAVYNIQNNYEGSNAGAIGVTGGTQNYDCTFNPLEKYIQAVEENKKLYERLLQAEKEKNELLQNMLNNRNQF
jgi:adenosylmethionine-8-amino-7-oxononanoate aminotransferase